MNESVAQYLAENPFHHETVERWPIQGNLRVRLCLSETLPPTHVSSSILAMVFNPHGEILFLWPTASTGSIAQFLVGGRPNEGETPKETAIREVGEETGWKIEPGRMIGFRHFFHLEPQHPDNDRPYPNFIQPIFSALALEFEPTLILQEDRIESEFINFALAENKTIPEQRSLLYAASSDLRSRLGIKPPTNQKQRSRTVKGALLRSQQMHPWLNKPGFAGAVKLKPS